MSRLRQTKVSTPANTPANTEELYYATSGPGYNTPPALMSVDESGNLAVVAHYAALSYRLLKVTILTSSGATWTPTNGCRAIYVECVGGGGASGGAATSSTQVSVGAGGGAGAYSASWITGITTTVPYACGPGGTVGLAGASGNAGTDTTWNTTTIVAKGGGGGAVMAAGSTLITMDGTAGGVSGSGTGDLKIGGGDGQGGFRLGTGSNQGSGGDGGSSIWGAGGFGRTAIGGGSTGTVGHNYGGGGGGSATTSTAVVGAAGGPGAIRVWEFA